MIQALVSGTIDGSMSVEPYISMGLTTNKIRVLLGSEEIIPSFQLSLIFFSNDFIIKHSDTLARFTAAYNDAIDFIVGNPDRGKAIVAQWTKTPLETARSMTLPGWSKDLPVAGIEAAEQAMIDNKILDTPVALSSYIFIPSGK